VSQISTTADTEADGEGQNCFEAAWETGDEDMCKQAARMAVSIRLKVQLAQALFSSHHH